VHELIVERCPNLGGRSDNDSVTRSTESHRCHSTAIRMPEADPQTVVLQVMKDGSTNRRQRGRRALPLIQGSSSGHIRLQWA
jgi:hypothetical protein